MRLPWQKRKPLILDRWEYEPYAFRPGMKYVIEINLCEMDIEQLRELQQFFYEEGVNVKIIPTKTGKAIRPLRVARMTRIEE